MFSTYNKALVYIWIYHLVTWLFTGLLLSITLTLPSRSGVVTSLHVRLVRCRELFILARAFYCLYICHRGDLVKIELTFWCVLLLLLTQLWHLVSPAVYCDVWFFVINVLPCRCACLPFPKYLLIKRISLYPPLIFTIPNTITARIYIMCPIINNNHATITFKGNVASIR